MTDKPDTPDSAGGPLSGLTVVEMAAIGPVPLAGQLLADLGADVIVVARRQSPVDPSDISMRNKRSIAINLKSAAGVDAVSRLVHQRDVLLEGFRPGVMERLGLGPDVFRDSHPELVYARMTGWGQDGPLSKSAGHDINYLAITGALHAIGETGRPPPPPLNLVADYGGGTMFLLFGVLSALYERRQSGKGQVVDVAMSEGVTAMMSLLHGMLSQQLWSTSRQSNFLDGGAPYYRCYATKDRKFVALGALEDQFFKEFLSISGMPASDLVAREDQSRWPELQLRYEQWFRTLTRPELLDLFAGTDACVTPVLDFDEAREHPHNLARGVFATGAGVAQSAPAPRFSRTPALPPEPPGAIGAESVTVLKECGFSEQDIQAMQDAGVLT